MKKKFDLKSFVCGVLVAVLIVTLTFPVSAAYTSKTISGLTGIKVYIDDQLFTPKDPNGKVVEPFVADGTTYLPMRAIAEALGVTVQWDGKTQGAYLGKHESGTPAGYLADMRTFQGKFDILSSDTDNLGNTHTKSVGYGTAVYILNGNYTRLTGTFYQRDYFKSSRATTTLTIYGDDKPLYTSTMKAGQQPERISVDLTGVLQLKVEITGSSCAFLGEAALWT